MRFLKGNVLFFALLLLAIMLFTYYAFDGLDTGAGESASCRVSFAEGCGGAGYEVFVDDSLLYAGAPLPADSQLVMRRYAAPGNRVSLYTSASVIRVVADGDTVSRALHGDRLFVVASHDGKPVIEAVD